jgi:type I restriction-modification system DNA methylase subunit
MARVKKANNKSSWANREFETTLWAAVDKLRGYMDAAEYKHVVIGLIFLKYISNSFEELRAQWSHLQANAKNPAIGIDNAKNATKGTICERSASI